MIEAQVICDSIAKDAPRLTTFRLRYPKFIHGEFMTHRVFSRNASSSRAVKVEKNIEEVETSYAAPIWWGKEQKGMASGEELKYTGYDFGGSLEHAKRLWEDTAQEAARNARWLNKIHLHKSIVNRVLEPFLHINVIATSCEEGWLNFFGLRLSRDAQPEMRALAGQMWAAWQESKPHRLENGQWHLPLVTDDEIEALNIEEARKISVGRCAHVSYGTDLLSIVKAIALHDRLLENRHFSPFEHQATPDVYMGECTSYIVSPATHFHAYWVSADQHGNFPGWRQYRKMIPGENLTPLPEGYEYVRP